MLTNNWLSRRLWIICSLLSYYGSISNRTEKERNFHPAAVRCSSISFDHFWSCDVFIWQVSFVWIIFDLCLPLKKPSGEESAYFSFKLSSWNVSGLSVLTRSFGLFTVCQFVYVVRVGIGRNPVWPERAITWHLSITLSENLNRASNDVFSTWVWRNSCCLANGSVWFFSLSSNRVISQWTVLGLHEILLAK